MSPGHPPAKGTGPLEEDRRLAEAARAMIAAAERSRSVAGVLRQRCPHVYRQLRRLRACRALRLLWGRSLNVDENTHQEIVHPAVLRAIGRLAGVPLRGRVVHAGLEHTYGYLFSLIETPHGYKRERWTRPDVEEGLGIRTPTLRPEPAQGTLLTNLTWFAGQVAFRDRPRELRLLRRLTDCLSPVVREYPYESLRGCRVVEEVLAGAGAEGKGGPVRLHTDLVRFPHPPAAPRADNHLLVYSVVTGRAASARLVTAFPVNQATADGLTAPGAEGEVVMDGTPYNAYVRGLSGRPFRALRSVVPFPAG